MKQKTPVKSNGTRVHDVRCSVRKTEERLNNKPLFQLGRVVITPAALQVLIPGDVVSGLPHHSVETSVLSTACSPIRTPGFRDITYLILVEPC
jgi:hypothetical protein